MRARLAFMVSVLIFSASAAQAGSFITAQELARRLGMTCNSDRLTSRLTLTDGTNEIIICPGMYNLMVNRRMVSMDSRAENRGGDVLVPDTVLAALRGHIRSASASPSYTPYTPSVPSVTYRPSAPGGWRAVVDAGHGGKDPGAVGHGGTREKSVNLGVALALRDALQSRGVNVVMTRQDDTFVELDERANVCNREGGDIFVSIHANASSSPSTTGSEIYFVDDQGPYTAIARGVAAANTMEISPQALGSNTMLDMTTKEILFGALLEEYRIESRDLAQCVQGALGGRMVIYGRGIYGNKGLRVLRFTRCPGVLVEVGFLSNPQTEQMLRQEHYQRSLAECIAEGMLRFKAGQEQTARYTR
jgi:N-acetylmuramoyl-L-alanine amidase